MNAFSLYRSTIYSIHVYRHIIKCSHYTTAILKFHLNTRYLRVVSFLVKHNSEDLKSLLTLDHTKFSWDTLSF